ncbi:hypothetical protein PLESTB_001769300 [Pleodorina starrii]|uniref:Uncharacterized protein n=1 Tax=Pleodorina starrii TaxID=330485 RepID=A0A9W6BZQ0_9CHLO|nr:hypothetical protein PLESTM_001864600 [Pleodorina starrii]GLC61556.1 hypothetical protein PLESTB_001769300 [Pleodorina starrii]GLC76835.1 hypothetical protein PLESTF_001846200 [Pleodorina starrii]
MMSESCLRQARAANSCRAGRVRAVVAGRKVAVSAFAAANVIKLDTGAWVVGPRYRSKGVVHFLGGAFAGAAPQVAYGLLLDSIAAAGYTAIATPYAVTFRHDECARGVRRQFLDSLQELRTGPRAGAGPGAGAGAARADLAPPGAPVFGVGHSNGSLLHLLIGSFFPGATESNIIMSFNNKQVKDAIPVPGLMENLPGALRAARAAAPNLPLPDLSALPLPVPLPSSGGDLLRGVASLLPRELGLDAAGQLSGAGLLLDQIPAVFDEVGGGATDFYPSPAESRSLISSGYCVSPTLLVRFSDDSIDESTEMARLLQPRLGSGVTLLTLPGNHLTPCGGDLPAWPTGPVFTPADTLVQALREGQQADIQRLCRQMVGWMDAIATR